MSGSDVIAYGPTLGELVANWIQAHCLVADADVGFPEFILSGWQLQNIVNHYEVRKDAVFDPNATRLIRAKAFVYRRSQTVRPQKVGKGPFMASVIQAEALGPVLFAGWARDGEAYDCLDHGCDCGFVYEYREGEPKGRPWGTPLIQVTATSVDQTDNIYKHLKPSIDQGPLHQLAPKTGYEFIRLPNGGEIQTVTSSADARLGQPVTFCAQDETQLWVKTNDMIRVANNQRRGLSGMGGRSWETTNPWDPSEESVAQLTYESQVTDINKDFPQAPSHLDFKVKAERRKILRYVYEGSPWVDLDNIEAEAVEIMERDPGQAERYYGNRIVYGQGTWLEGHLWDACAAEDAYVPGGTEVVVGMDGSDVDDWTALRAQTEDGFQFTPRFRNGTPMIWNPADYPNGQVPRLEVDAAVESLFSQYSVVRMYVDPPHWQTEIDQWQAVYGEHIVYRWETYRPIAMFAACERMVTDVVKTDSTFSHDDDPIIALHVRNARKAERPQERYVLGKPSQAQKIDGAIASVICNEAAGDATEAKEWTTVFPVFMA